MRDEGGEIERERALPQRQPHLTKNQVSYLQADTDNTAWPELTCNLVPPKALVSQSGVQLCQDWPTRVYHFVLVMRGWELERADKCRGCDVPTWLHVAQLTAQKIWPSHH